MIDRQLTWSLSVVHCEILTNDFTNVGSVTETGLPCSSDRPVASAIIEWDTVFPLKSIKTIERTDDDKIVALNLS